MVVSRELSDTEILNELGNRIRQTRLAVPMTQRGLAQRSGVSLRTVINLESGCDVSLSTLLKVLRVLGLTENIENTVPEQKLSPILMSQKHRPRLRVYEKKTTAQSWKWGDE